MYLGVWVPFIISILTITTPSCNTYVIDVSINPEIIYLNSGTVNPDSVVTITCQATGLKEVLTLIPFNMINGTFIEHPCVGSYRFINQSQRFSTLSFYYTYTSDNIIFTTTISLNPIIQLDDGLLLGCAFYNLETETYDVSHMTNITIIVIEPTTTTTIATTATTTATTATTTTTAVTTGHTATIAEITTLESTQGSLIKSQDFYITIGTLSVVMLGLLIVIFILITVLGIYASTRRQQAPIAALIPRAVLTRPVFDENQSIDSLTFRETNVNFSEV
ncbi:hypothetical protein LOD99_4124 [Oopsacas minuta]|uniref:Uncharacterized protein n=1 Tax=Oopsacas minuta TaxID=111878 RepID=A0AAV7JUQ3_9METZ|nr:hypothetical protein LOD99_4124 [Oopsacas minuta]